MSFRFHKSFSVFRDIFVLLFFAALLAFFLRYYVVASYRVPTASMSPSLLIGDMVLANRLAYGAPLPGTEKVLFASKPKIGDIIVFDCRSKLGSTCVKRLIGMAGDRIQLRRGVLYVNNKRLQSRQRIKNERLGKSNVFTERHGKASWVIWSSQSYKESWGPFVVSPGSFFVMSDHRDDKQDSRSWGEIPIRNIIGKISLVWFSIDWQDAWQKKKSPEVRWGRFFKVID